MSSYHGTWRVFSERPVPPAVLAEARKLAGELLEHGVFSKYVALPDGTTIRILIQDDLVNVYVTAPSSEGTKSPPPPSDLWAPRGFVVYPAFNGNPAGFGLPIVNDPSFAAYDPQNTAPGLDLNRWTAGGPCGEVLISRDKDAGYPQNRQRIPVPLLYDPTKGPVFQWASTTMYDNRPADGSWKSYRLELDAPRAFYPDENVLEVHSLFEAINNYRDANSKTKLTLNPRGYYHPAQVMVSIMKIAGSTAETNPSYPANYNTADDRLTKDGFTAALQGTTFTSFNRGDNPTASELRASGGFPLSAWQGDTTANAALLNDVGPAAFADVGFRGGFWTTDIISRTRWIEAGNCYWQSSDAELPALSWFGFASVNLAWETYPAIYDATNYLTAPLVPSMSFTSTTGDCWLNYPRNTAPKVADVDPGMSRYVYARGRAIAMAPRGGLVWGASLVNMGDHDRLIALVHHPEDQNADYTHEGWTRFLRVWWCDIPVRNSLRATPELTICGEASSDPWGWKGGQLLDIGAMPPPSYGTTFPIVDVMSLKYASQWRFSPDGTRAVCLRDYGGYGDYKNLLAFFGIFSSVGLSPRPVELLFHVTDGATSTEIVWHDYVTPLYAPPRPITQPPDTSDPITGAMYEFRTSAIAADYTPTGTLIYALVGAVGDYIQDFSYFYAGVGPAGTNYISDMQHRVMTGAGRKTASQNFVPSGSQVVDVNDGVFSFDGIRPRYNQSDGSYTFPDCFPFTEALVHGVRMARRGAVLDETWYPAPDGVVFSALGVCSNNVGSTPVIVMLPPAASQTVQAFYGKRAGDFVFCTQVSPVPNAVYVLDAPPDDATCGCEIEAHKLATATHLMAYNEWKPRGGRAISSVPLPEHDWLIYAKVV